MKKGDRVQLPIQTGKVHESLRVLRLPMKFNELPVYFEAGFKSGEAMTQQDIARSKFHFQWFMKAKTLETPEYRAEAEKEFQRGYRLGRGLKS